MFKHAVLYISISPLTPRPLLPPSPLLSQSDIGRVLDSLDVPLQKIVEAASELAEDDDYTRGCDFELYIVPLSTHLDGLTFSEAASAVYQMSLEDNDHDKNYAHGEGGTLRRASSARERAAKGQAKADIEKASGPVLFGLLRDGCEVLLSPLATLLDCKRDDTHVPGPTNPRDWGLVIAQEQYEAEEVGNMKPWQISRKSPGSVIDFSSASLGIEMTGMKKNPLSTTTTSRNATPVKRGKARNPENANSLAVESARAWNERLPACLGGLKASDNGLLVLENDITCADLGDLCVDHVILCGSVFKDDGTVPSVRDRDLIKGIIDHVRLETGKHVVIMHPEPPITFLEAEYNNVEKDGDIMNDDEPSSVYSSEYEYEHSSGQDARGDNSGYDERTWRNGGEVTDYDDSGGGVENGGVETKGGELGDGGTEEGREGDDDAGAKRKQKNTGPGLIICLQGSAMSSRDLDDANATRASNIMILSSQSHAQVNSSSISRDINATDSGCIKMTTTIRNYLSANKVATKAAAKAAEKAAAKAGGKAKAGANYHTDANEPDSSPHLVTHLINSENTLVVDPTEWWPGDARDMMGKTDHGIFTLAPAFASGCVFTNALMETMLCNAFYTRGTCEY